MIHIVECGRFARKALASGPGEVCAVFRRSFYLRYSEGRFACLGDGTLGRGPLNARLPDHRAFGAWAVGDRVAVSLEGARLWRPHRIESRVDRARLAANVDALVRAATQRPAREGLGGAITGAASPLLEHVRPALGALDAWLSDERAAVPRRARDLIGLGPGLTPSGDDYLGGLMVGLRAAGRARAAAALWKWLDAHVSGRTSAISRAHLAAAAHGEVHEALHACVAALFEANAMPRNTRWSSLLALLDAVGHCSGRDGLAGVAAVAQSSLR